MSDASLTARAAAPTIEIIRRVAPDQLGLPTPCTDWDVRRLVTHLLFWGPSLEGAARKEQVAPPVESEASVDLTTGDWPGALATQFEKVAAAWREDSAWEGMTYMGGPMELPAPLVGGMVVGEMVVHGWDLGRATGQHPAWDDELLECLYDETAKNTEQGRQIGVYGPEVTVPESAPAFYRILGLTGRDPYWSG